MLDCAMLVTAHIPIRTLRPIDSAMIFNGFVAFFGLPIGRFSDSLRG